MVLKTILITGCGLNSIGASLAREFHLRGHRVFATGRSDSEIDPALTPLGMRTLVLDVTSDASIGTAVSAVDRRLDILINCAGLLQISPFADTPAEEARHVFEVNVVGAWAVTRAFLPILLQSRGMVVNLGSVNEVFCPPFMAAYNASKAALEAFGRTIRRELAPLGVRVILLKTGSVRSGLFGNTAPTVVPEESLYAPVRDWIESRGFLRSARYIELEDYAKVVATDLLKDNVKPVIWRGGLAYLAWLLSWLGWETMMASTRSDAILLATWVRVRTLTLLQDSQMIKGNGLNKLHYGLSE